MKMKLSAKGSMVNFRDHARQGIFPIRGKFPNAISTPRDKMVANEEFAALVTIIGGGYGKSFDIEKVKWDKVIIMTDADMDGNHIRALLLMFFMVYMPGLVENGRVYSAVPPLYGVADKKGNYTYYIDNIDYARSRQVEFARSNTLTDINGKPITNTKMSKLFIDNLYYTYEVKYVARRKAIDPYLLEFLLINRDKTDKQLKTIFNKKFRFLKRMERIEGRLFIEIELENQLYSIFFDNEFINFSSKVIDYLDRNMYHYYILNSNVVSLYELMSIYENFNKGNTKETGRERYKGLGEMDGRQLFESTVDPNPEGKRHLIRYRMDDIKREIEFIKVIESDKGAILKDMKVTREQVLG